VTTHVSPASSSEAAAYFQAYLLAKGALEHLIDMVHTASEGFADDRARLRAFYAGLLGLLDQAWRVEGINGRLLEGALIERLIDYGQACCAEDDASTSYAHAIASGKLSQVHAAEELVKRLADMKELGPDVVASLVAQHAPAVAELLATDAEDVRAQYERWHDEDA
jgi:hypothetical protein